MPFSSGDRVGPYEIVAPLGAGGMGTVYRARDPRLGREVVIKILQERLLGDREYLRRFEQEARSASALNHPNIITIHEIGEVHSAPFIAMELVDGKRLRDLLNEAPLSSRRILQIATQVADGLAAAHDRGIVHRDLKPENVMITPDGLVKILDFGLARLRPAPAETDESTSELMTAPTRAGAVIGTAAYMSPEQASGGKVDFRSDQFSFGSILFEMATGKHPFRRETTLDTLSAIVHEDPEPIEKLNPRIPQPLRWTIERCLAKDPRERYASTRDLARELHTIREHLTETTTGESVRPIVRRLKRGPAFGVAAAVLTLAIAVGTWTLLRPRPPRGERLPSERWVLVLPFKDYSGGPNSEPFGRGFAEAVSARLAELGRPGGVQVISPVAASKELDAKLSLERLARELGANLLVDASIQRAGDQMMVSYSLLQPRGVVLAGNSITRPTADLFGLLNEIAESLAAELQLPRSPTGRIAAAASGLTHSDDQDRYLQALGQLQRYEDGKAVDQATSTLEELATRASSSALVHAALARAYLYKYRLTHEPSWTTKAIAASERSKQIDAAAPEVHLTLGETRLATGKIEEAIEEFRRALAFQPNSVEAAFGLADALEQAGEFAEAEKMCRRVIDLRPTWWAGYNRLGVFYYNRGEYENARRMFAEVVRLSPDNVRGYANLGVLEMMLGDLDAALRTYTRGIKVGPNADGYSNLGTCYYLLGRYEDAASAFSKAIELTPQLSVYWANRGDAYQALGRREEAQISYRKAIELANKELKVNPKDAQLHATLARCLARSGNFATARKHMAVALHLQPKQPSRLLQAAQVANLSGNEREAVQWLERAFAAGYPRVIFDRLPEFENLRRKNLLGRISKSAASSTSSR